MLLLCFYTMYKKCASKVNFYFSNLNLNQLPFLESLTLTLVGAYLLIAFPNQEHLSDD